LPATSVPAPVSLPSSPSAASAVPATVAIFDAAP
jgi:hypothetical protein